MEDDDDFTFPTVVAAAPAPAPTEGQLGGPRPVAQLLHHQLPVPDLAAASTLWPFAGSPKATAAPPSSPAHVAADEEEEARVSGSSRREEKQRAEAEAEAEEEEVRRAAADEERMDLLWEGATAAPATQPTGSGAVHAEPPPKPKPKPNPRGAWHAEPPPKPKPKPNPRRAADSDDDDKKRAAAVADAERMDKLWESFNEELLLLRRHARSKSAAAAGHPAGGLGPAADRWYLCNYPPSDAESEETAASSPAERRGYGCAPTMLRASSRAGGAGQFCGGSSSSSPRGGRGAAAGWALLLRLFRRLFAVDKAPAPAPSRSHGSIYVP
ncbi:hypothetical protein SETIT_1G192700v2 [Setaria italica]|nr:skin secretory protein xP2 [Setaria italica]RCV06801.1 hypothetical protein SETIT_1G192700v2 [Setaria italica]